MKKRWLWLVLGVVAANVGKAHAGTNTWTSNGPYQVVQVLTDVRALAVDPTTPGTVYAGTYGSGVYKSTDKGSSWMQRSRGLGNQRVWALAWLLHTGVGHRGNS